MREFIKIFLSLSRLTGSCLLRSLWFSLCTGCYLGFGHWTCFHCRCPPTPQHTHKMFSYGTIIYSIKTNISLELSSEFLLKGVLFQLCGRIRKSIRHFGNVNLMVVTMKGYLAQVEGIWTTRWRAIRNKAVE